MHRDRKDVYAWGIVAVSWLIGQHYAVQGLWHAPQAGGFSYRTTYGIVLVVTFGYVAVAAIALGWLRWANWRWLTVAGALTYPFYLVHEHLGWVVIKALHQGLHIPSYATFLLTAASMLLLAWLLNRYVENWLTPDCARRWRSPGRPWGRLGRRAGRSPRTAPPPPRPTEGSRPTPCSR